MCSYISDVSWSILGDINIKNICKILAGGKKSKNSTKIINSFKRGTLDSCKVKFTKISVP